jgi:hypothetical protein
MRNTVDVTGGKPIAVLLQFISGVSAINRLIAFYDIHGGKRVVLFVYFFPDTTRDELIITCLKSPMARANVSIAIESATGVIHLSLNALLYTFNTLSKEFYRLNAMDSMTI